MSYNAERELECLKHRYRLLGERIVAVEDWVDTISSPMWKRAIFVLQGFRFRQLGVWYRAPWNLSGWSYEDTRRAVRRSHRRVR